MPSRSDTSEANRSRRLERLESARLAADSLRILLDAVRAGELTASARLVARIEGAVVVLRILCPKDL